MLYLVGRAFFFVVFKLLFGFKVYGRENVPLRGGFIIASNHASLIDPIALGVASSRPINFMAKQELFSNIFFAFILRNVYAFPVKRETIDSTSIKEAIRRLKNGRGLLLFPEGARRESIDVLDAKRGVGLLACKARVPIVPAFIKGSDCALPKGKKFPRRHRVSVYFGPPKEWSISQDYGKIAQEVMLAIKQLGQESAVEKNNRKK